VSAAKKGGGGGMSLERPSKRAAKTAALEEGIERIAVDVPAPLYRAVKVRCIERKLSLKAYLLELLAKDGIS
jgi:hypothetical protein